LQEIHRIYNLQQYKRRYQPEEKNLYLFVSQINERKEHQWRL
jgi:hypothetical protein